MKAALGGVAVVALGFAILAGVSGYYVFRNFDTRSIDNAKKIWSDIRPHPVFDTLEIRVCDIPMRVDETLAIAALIQATMVNEVDPITWAG